jgi:hypothetical protein
MAIEQRGVSLVDIDRNNGLQSMATEYRALWPSRFVD